MIDDSESPASESSTKKRKIIERNDLKSWATCSKSSFKNWWREDYLAEFNMSGGDWDVLDVQVTQVRKRLTD
jgi:hypothetical protein